jgi:hypothetical protein
MERKNIFICRKQKEVQMLRGFMAALEIIKRESAKWDGKVLNKRYTDAMTAAVENIAKYDAFGRHQLPAVSVCFETTYYGERTGRIELKWHDNRAGNADNIAVYLEWDEVDVKYADCNENKNAYNVNGRLVYDKLCEAIDELSEHIGKMIKDNEKAINMADEVIQRYERINAILKAELSDVPKCLWGTYSVEASIY